MSLKQLVGTLVITAFAQSLAVEQIHWVDSADQAGSLARQFNLPVLVYVTSDHCAYCRRMDREVWSNPDIISMVEEGFIPLKLNAVEDAAMVAALKVRAFPTTLLFSPHLQFSCGATGYLPPNHLAGLLRSSRRAQFVSHQVQQPE